MKTLCFLLFISFSTCSAYAQNRSIWVWDVNLLLTVGDERNIFINQCKEDTITDVFLYAFGIENNTSDFEDLNQVLHCNGLRVWAMDGYRGYFSDWYGPSGYYAFVQSIINFNASVNSDAQFFGVHGDNEPQDGQDEPLSSFHNGIRDSQLSSTMGGVWHASQVADREGLMVDWLTITQTAFEMCHANNLMYGQAMPSWVDNYFGEPVHCTYNDQFLPVLNHMCSYLDEYVIMSYNTDPNNVINRVAGEFTYISSLGTNAPKVYASLESHCGVGATVSYCDNPNKNSKLALRFDMGLITDSLSQFSAYGGFAIHDWTGWKGLSPTSANTQDPIDCLTVDVLENAAERPLFHIEGEVLLLDASLREPQLLIISMDGRTLVESHNRSTSVNLQQLPSGAYIIHLRNQPSDQAQKQLFLKL